MVILYLDVTMINYQIGQIVENRGNKEKGMQSVNDNVPRFPLIPLGSSAGDLEALELSVTLEE